MEEKKKKIDLKIIIFIAIVIIAIVGIVIFITKNKEIPTETKPESKISETTYKIGDTVKTDIVEFTLNDSQLTIALSNKNDENYYLPKEYNAKEDVGNPYVASVGHTFAYVDLTLSAIDRSKVNIQNASSLCNKVFYQNKECNQSATLGLEKKIISITNTINGKWKHNTSTNILLSPSEKSQFRGYIDLNVNIENLKDTYYITFKLPNSKGNTQDFTYEINAEN